MIGRANMAGIILEICLLALFVIYIAFLVLSAARRRKELELENQIKGDVLRGVNILFASRYLLVDLENDRYAYLAGTRSLNNRIPMEGVYSEIIELHAADVVGEEGKAAFCQFSRIDTLRKNPSHKDSVVHECHVSRKGKEEWEHLIGICLERRGNVPVRVLYVRQNVTEQVRRQREQTQALQDALMQAQHATRRRRPSSQT